MKLHAMEETSIPDYVEFEHSNLSFQEKQERISRLLNNLKIGKLNPEQYLSLVENNIIIGLLRWRVGDLDGQKVVETLGSPSIALPEKRHEAMEVMIQSLLELSSKHMALTKLTLDEELVGNISPEFFLKFNLALTFQNQGYYRDLQSLETSNTTLTLENIEEDNEAVLLSAANLLTAIQADSFDPTAIEDLEDPLATIEDRIAQGQHLESIGGASKNYIVKQHNQEIGLLFPRYTHIKERRGGMFCGIIPEFRQQGLGRQIHYLGLEQLKQMGALHYRGETFADNTPMKSIFAANQCLLIPNSNYWEYQTISAPKT
jgi:predicted acetyltransferase